jgi:hypothetical protein
VQDGRSSASSRCTNLVSELIRSTLKFHGELPLMLFGREFRRLQALECRQSSSKMWDTEGGPEQKRSCCALGPELKGKES